MSKRRSAALAVLALAAAAVFVLPASSASAGTATVSNACANSVTPNFSQIEVTTSGDDGVDTALPGQALSGSVSQSAAIPGAIFVAGYNLGLLQVGVNNIPANVRTTIEATNTVQGSQNTNTVGGTPPNGSVSVTTTITDPDGTPGTGDETATDASFAVTYDNLNWTAGASGTIDYRQQSIAVAPPTAANNALLINALVGGVFNVQFRCAPGTVTPPDPGTITLIDPAPSFDTTQIEPVRQISISDPTVTEGGAATFTVSLDQPSIGTVTVAFMTADGTATAGLDYTAATGTVTFVPGDTSETVTVQTIDDAVAGETPPETFNVNLSNATGNAAISVPTAVGMILDNDVENLPPTADAGPDQTVGSGATVQLDGTGSTDPDPGDTLNFAWTAPAGITLSDPTSATPTFTAPTGPATLTFDLTVCDRPAGDPDQLCDTDSVTITVSPLPTISISDASATEGGAESFTVTLSSASSQTVTVAFATADGTAMAPGDYTSATGTVTFVPGDTSETVTVQTIDDALCEATEMFDVNLSSPTNATITDGLGVGTILDNDACPDATGVVIVNGPVTSAKTSKNFVFKVTNVGTSPITVNESNITSSVDVNGTVTGSVAVNPFTKTLNPGASTRVKLSWSYPAGSLLTGDAVVFHACVDVAGDVDETNNCDDQTATAK